MTPVPDCGVRIRVNSPLPGGEAEEETVLPDAERQEEEDGL